MYHILTHSPQGLYNIMMQFKNVSKTLHESLDLVGTEPIAHDYTLYCLYIHTHTYIYIYIYIIRGRVDF
jgi:hypothetical protein